MNFTKSDPNDWVWRRLEAILSTQDVQQRNRQTADLLRGFYSGSPPKLAIGLLENVMWAATTNEKFEAAVRGCDLYKGQRPSSSVLSSEDLLHVDQVLVLPIS